MTSRLRIERMTEAIGWVRSSEHSFVIFEALGTERYVQFASRPSGAEEELVGAAAMAVPQPLLVLAAAGARGGEPGIGSVELPCAPPAGWAAHGRWFGEPDHEPLIMEVGSGLWPDSNGPALAADDAAVARLAAIGLTLGGGDHACLNFCRFGVTEPSDILAALADEILVHIAHAAPSYRLRIKRGQFASPSSPSPMVAA